MSLSRKQSIQKKLNAVKFVLFTIAIGLIFFLVGSIIFYTKIQESEGTLTPSDFREEVDLKQEIGDIFFSDLKEE